MLVELEIVTESNTKQLSTYNPSMSAAADVQVAIQIAAPREVNK